MTTWCVGMVLWFLVASLLDSFSQIGFGVEIRKIQSICWFGGVQIKPGSSLHSESMLIYPFKDPVRRLVLFSVRAKGRANKREMAAQKGNEIVLPFCTSSLLQQRCRSVLYRLQGLFRIVFWLMF